MASVPKPTAADYADADEAYSYALDRNEEEPLGAAVDSAFAAGVAAERARIVAALRDSVDLVGMFAYAVDFADLIESGWRS